MFGGGGIPFGSKKSLFGQQNEQASSPQPSAPEKKKKKAKTGKKTSESAFSPPKITIENLDELKKMVDSFPPEVYDSLNSELKLVVDNIKNGSLDSMDPKELERILKDTQEGTNDMFAAGGLASLRASATSAANDRANADMNNDERMDKIVTDAVRQLLTLSDADWKQAGIEKPDFSKPLSFEKLVELDRLMGNHGIKVSDFETYLSATELKKAEVEDEGMDVLSELTEEEDRDSKAALKYFTSLVKARHRRHAHRSLAEKKSKMDAQKLRPGDLERSIESHMRKHDFAKAVEVFNDAMKWDTSVLGFEPIDMGCINAVITAHLQMDNLPSAIRTFELIPKFEFVPTARTYNTFMFYGSDIHDDRIVLEWYEKLKASGIKPDTQTFAALIGTYAAIGNEKLALKWFDEMTKTELDGTPDTSPYAHIMRMYGLVLDDKLPEALDWTRKMLQSGALRTEYTTKVVAEIHARVTEERKKLVPKQEEDESAKSIQQMFVEAFNNNNATQVAKLWDSMRYNRAHLTEHLWSLRIRFAANTAQLDTAARIYDELIEEGHKPSRTTCGVMVQVYRRMGDLEKAQEALDRSKTAPAGDSSAFNPARAPSTPTYGANPYLPRPTAASRLR